MDSSNPLKPAELAETCLTSAIIENIYPIDSHLPPERELCKILGVTRPTLREVLQRLSRDGWIEIHHGRSTRVRNYWEEGNLSVLSTISKHKEQIPPNFINNLLQIRFLLAPTYVKQAIQAEPDVIIEYLNHHTQVTDDPQAYAFYDWEFHLKATTCSGNPVFTLIYNGFGDLYKESALKYFALPESRAHSRQFYRELLTSTKEKNVEKAEQITRRVMQDSMQLWEMASSQ